MTCTSVKLRWHARHGTRFQLQQRTLQPGRFDGIVQPSGWTVSAAKAETPSEGTEAFAGRWMHVCVCVCVNRERGRPRYLVCCGGARMQSPTLLSHRLTPTSHPPHHNLLSHLLTSLPYHTSGACDDSTT